MGKIYRKNIKNPLITPKLILLAGITPAVAPMMAQNASADSVDNTDQSTDSAAAVSSTASSTASNASSAASSSSAETSQDASLNAVANSANAAGNNTANLTGSSNTGWDSSSAKKGTMADANTTASAAGQSAASNAASKAAANTKAAGSATSDTKTGWIDVYADHSNLDESIRRATAQGVNLVRDDSVVQSGNASQTAQNTSQAESYYASMADTISSTGNKYVTDLSNYHGQVDQNNRDAAQANGQMDALRTNLAAQGQTVVLQSKTFSQDAVNADTNAINQSIAIGKQYRDAKNAVDALANIAASDTLFQSAEAQGKIKLNRMAVTIANAGDQQTWTNNMNNDYTNLQNYLNNLNNQNGSIPDDQKPTFNYYTYSVDPNLQAQYNTPVTVYRYEPVAVQAPLVPTVNYHYYDIRSQMSGNSTYQNKDSQTIANANNANAGGQQVAQAMVHQTVGIATDNEPLPSERFDKISDITLTTQVPANATYNDTLSNNDPTNWTVTYDKNTRTVTQKATPQYLVQVNLNQHAKTSGDNSGTTDGQFTYSAPKVYFTLDKDDTTYQTHTTAIINNEYMYVGRGIQIRTDSADPTKVNTNSSYQNIDGKAVLPGSINNYILGWDFNQYKNVNVDSEMQQKGLKLVDDFPEDAVNVTGPVSVVNPTTGQVLFQAQIPSGVKVGDTGSFKDMTKQSNGSDSDNSSDLTWTLIDKTNAPDDLKDKIKGQAFMIQSNGVNNNFYKTYVQGGQNLNVIIPMTTKRLTNNNSDGTVNNYNGNSYSNVAYQSDFGNDYTTNAVGNDVPTLKPSKDAVLSFGNLTSLDIKNNPQAQITNGNFFKYRLTGSTFPTNLSEDIKNYSFDDSMDNNSDEYDGTYIVQTDNPIQFKAGSTLSIRYPNGLSAGADISKYFTQTVNRNSDNTNFSKISLSADTDFLSQIDYSQSSIKFDAFLTTKRIANTQGVQNTFNENVNNIPYASNTVTTNSAENSVDKLQDVINQMNATIAANKAAQDKVNSDQAATNDKVINALSVIVNTVNQAKSDQATQAKTLQDNIDKANSRIDTLNTKVDSNKADTDKQIQAISAQIKVINAQIQIVQNNANNQLTGVASSAVTTINGSNAANVQNSATTQINQIQSNTAQQLNTASNSINASIARLFNELTSDTSSKAQNATVSAPKTSKVTIHDKSVKTKAGALKWAVKHHIKASLIQTVFKDSKGRYVVVYKQQ